MTRMTTHGRFSAFTISIATEDLPEPELPAIPIMLMSDHGGEYLAAFSAQLVSDVSGSIASSQSGGELYARCIKASRDSSHKSKYVMTKVERDRHDLDSSAVGP